MPSLEVDTEEQVLTECYGMGGIESEANDQGNTRYMPTDSR
ncbi:MAG: hypothetical protein RLP02_24740 [Coleofasciculus sp. C2-GNP5-27]